MFRTIKGKIIFFVALVMVISTAVNIYFTKRDVGNAMLRAQETSARNILHSLDLMLRDDYQNLLLAKRTMTLTKRNQLENTTRMIESVLNGFHVPDDGADSADNLKKALTWLRSAPFKNVDVYLMDRDSRILFSSNNQVSERTYPGIEDIKHRNISWVMQFSNLRENGDYAIFNPAPEHQGSVLAFFLPFSPWELTIGASVDISDIEAEAQEKTKKIIASLYEYSKQLKISENGFVLMIDQDRKSLIPPPGNMQAWTRDIAAHLSDKKTVESGGSLGFYAVSNISVNMPGGHREKPLIIYSSYFKPLKWFTGVVVPLSEIKAPAEDLVIRQTISIALMFVAGLIAVFILVTRIATPLNLLSLYAQKLPELDFTQPLEEKSPIDDLPLKYKDEVGALATSFILMRRSLSKNIQDLVRITASRQAIESELNIAREIQLGMVPKTFPSFPEHDEFDLYATLKPAREIGGDLYDFFLIDKDHICFTLGDVSDKGIPAALFMVVTRTLIRTLSENGGSPAMMMKDINNTLSADNPRSMFVTLIIGILDIRTGEVTYANGGHNPPILVSREKGTHYIQGKKEPLVGAMPGMPYSDSTFTLNPKESFFLYTDGVNEAMDPEGRQYSSERLLTKVEGHGSERPEKVVLKILDSIRAHSKTAPQSDDIAMLMIKYHGPNNLSL